MRQNFPYQEQVRRKVLKTSGQRRFTVDEFSSAQQIQGYFSRAAAELRHATAPQSGRESDERGKGCSKRRITYIGPYRCPRPVPSRTPYRLRPSEHMHSTIQNKEAR